LVQVISKKQEAMYLYIPNEGSFKEAFSCIDKIINHNIVTEKLLRSSLFYRELISFININCQSSDFGLMKKLYEYGIYSRLAQLLDETERDLKRSETSFLDAVLTYEKRLELLFTLTLISKMNFKVSSSLNKATGYTYIALTYYTGFLPKFTHAKRSFRILNRLDSYSSDNDPQIQKDAEDKFMKESLHNYDQLQATFTTPEG